MEHFKDQPHEVVWRNCLRAIKKNINAQSYKTWFEPIKPVKLDNDVLTIMVPNKFFYEWLEEHYVNLLKSTIRQELGENARLEYQILVTQNPNSTQGTPLSPSNVPSTQIKNPMVIPGIKKVRIDANLITHYTFDTYVEGDCNRLARTGALAVAKKPEGNSFNPLFIYGDTGLGKTHLIHAVGNEVKNRYPDKAVLYTTMEHFANQFIESVKNNSINEFINFYYLIDVLLVDDIHILAGKQKTQDIFFHIFNQLHQAGKLIIMTSDRSPKDLTDIEDRLLSRFKWGLTADLQAPDYETRMAIAERKLNKEGIEFPQDVVEFISYNIKKNIRELEGVLIRVIAQSSFNRREIDIELAREVVKNFVSEISKEVTMEYIVELVAKHYGLTPDKLQGKSRKRQIVMARQLSMYFSKSYTNKSLKTIGESFGGRDHSTVIYSCKAVQDLLDTDTVFKDSVTALEQQIKLNIK